jgi:hypothetical protein
VVSEDLRREAAFKPPQRKVTNIFVDTSYALDDMGRKL